MIKILSKEQRIKYWTFHFIIIPCVQFHFRASTIYSVQCMYNVHVHEGITLTKRQSARLIRTIDIKTHFYLSAQNQLCTM